MKWNRLLGVSGVVGVVIMTACVPTAPPEPPSPIVQKLEAAGSGDLSKTSSDAIQQWLGPHRELAVQVESMCKAVRPKATAKWADSTEGRVCTASAQLAFYRFTPDKGDGKTFKGGWK